jgi:oligoendopeptidase F
VDAYEKDIPQILAKFGFTPEKARYLADNIVVDSSRGAGHAMGAGMRGAKAHLRTRVDGDGMTYKGFNIAAHELGHNVEQTFSLNDIDFTPLEGVPNTAFTEAFAMVFQGHDLDALNLVSHDANAEIMRTLNDFWNTFEISGVALVDMDVWHWMYAHPDATAEQLRDATLQIAKNIWNKYYAPVFGQQDVVLLAVYSHMIDSFMYLPDYPIGHLIAFQVEEQMKKAGAIGPEFERMAKMGRVTPDMWMLHATGMPVGAEALLTATEQALEASNSANLIGKK